MGSRLLVHNANEIAKGSFDVNIYHGEFDARKLVAVKRIQRRPSDAIFLEEARLMLKISGHPNILKYYGIETNIYFSYAVLTYYVIKPAVFVFFFLWFINSYIATELCKCTLEDHLRLIEQQNGQHERAIILQLTRAVSYLHEKRIVHRDIKPENIFIAQDYGFQNGLEPRIKLADFGKSIRLENNIDQLFNNDKDDNGSPKLGTIGWQAPELYTRDQCDFKMDIFSLGLVFAYTLSIGRRHIFMREPRDDRLCAYYYYLQLQQNIRRLNSEEANNDFYFTSFRNMVGLGNDLINSIRSMVRVEPNDRWTIETVLQDRFLFRN